MNEYLMLIRENLENYTKLSPKEIQEDIEKHVKWVEELVEAGHFKEGNPLSTKGKYIKGSKRIVTDGPFIEVKEGVSGYFFLLADSLEEATDIAKGCPSLESGGTVEIREIMKTED